MLDQGTYRQYHVIAENGARHPEYLSETEHGFCVDMVQRFCTYNYNTYMSMAQTDWLDKIETKLQAELGGAYESFAGASWCR